MRTAATVCLCLRFIHGVKVPLMLSGWVCEPGR